MTSCRQRLFHPRTIQYLMNLTMVLRDDPLPREHHSRALLNSCSESNIGVLNWHNMHSQCGQRGFYILQQTFLTLNHQYKNYFAKLYRSSAQQYLQFILTVHKQSNYCRSKFSLAVYFLQIKSLMPSLLQAFTQCFHIFCSSFIRLT